jgi:hypothetical protein
MLFVVSIYSGNGTRLTHIEMMGDEPLETVYNLCGIVEIRSDTRRSDIRSRALERDASPLYVLIFATMIPVVLCTLFQHLC